MIQRTGFGVIPLVLVVPLVLPVLACNGGGGDPIVPGKACSSVAVGNLVITEIMANPSGEDSGNEWLEIYNASGRELDVAGLEILHSRVDTTNERVHTVTALRLPPGYSVLGSAPAGALPAHVDYGYGDALGGLLNTAGRLVLRCDTTILDLAVYDGAADGASRILSAGAPLDPAANDVAASWCDATVDFDDENQGSPGAANETCGGSGATTCDDGGTTRDIVSPAAGQLVISEIMPNPRAVSDGDGEWIELTLLADADLNGLQLGATPGMVKSTITSATCLRRAAGTRVVLARGDESMRNGGLPPVAATFGFDLPNGGGTLFVGAGGVVLDEISWTGSGDGVSTSLDPEKLSATANDDAASWCPSESEYGDGDRGTPGAANDPCGAVLPPGQCLDGGVARATVSPVAGDLVVTEIFANPAGSDAGKEWFEILVKRDVDLNGLELGVTFPEVAQRLQGTACLRATAGSYLVLAHNDGNAEDGGLPRVDFRTRFDLGNTTPSVFVGLGGVLLDAISLGAAADGASHSLSPASLDPTANDAPASWCVASTPFGDGTGRGTPGSANTCGGANQCLEGGVPRAIDAPQPGELVISEVMADPSRAGEEEGEWLELTILADVDLNGLQLGTVPGTPRQTLADATCLRHPAGSRLVFARNVVAAENGGLPRVDHRLGFALTNSNGALFVASAGTLLDAVTWTTADTGISRSLDPGKHTPQANDEPTSWCPSTSTYGAGDRGTPGAPNDSCPLVLPEGQCLDGETVRDVVRPAAGDLVVTEIMPNPDGGDEGKEWFEVLVTRDVDLAGLELGTVFPTVSERLAGPDCRRATAGSVLVFAGNDGSVPDGGLPRVDHRFRLTLVNADRGLFLASAGALVDAITYTTVTSGVARSLTASAQTATGNDELGSWCDATTSYGAGGFGTPGVANPECGAAVPDGQCLDGELTRDAVRPVPGDLVITEVYPDPVGPDDGREWFEVLVTRDVDLGGLQLGATFPDVRQTLPATACLRATAGSSLIFAGNDGSLPDGGLPRVDHRITFNLVNADRGVFVARGGVLLDEMSYGDVEPGRSRSLGEQYTTPEENDARSRWCDAITPYGFPGNFGTPGAANPRCLERDECRDPGGEVRKRLAPRRGDLVITELLADPSGADAGKEWFEVRVERSVDLNGLELGTAYPTALQSILSETCLRVEAGTNLVLARNDGTQPDGGLPRVDVRLAFDLANAGSGLFLALDDERLDEVSYASVRPGVARSLSGDTLGPMSNDLDGNWCDAEVAYGDGMLGTPGITNPICVRAGECRAGGVIRDAVAPSVGDLVITEIFPDATGADTNKEWFEVLVTSDVDLNGLELGTQEGVIEQTLAGTECRRVTAGSLLVFAQAETGNGGLPGVDVLFDFDLGNTGGGELILGLGGQIVDAAPYAQATQGVARSLSADRLGAGDNDDPSSWCDAETPFGDGDLGTPGAENRVCLLPGQCRDGEVARAIDAPAPGELVITEIYPDPTTPEPGKEWIEVLVTSPVDLNGVRLGTGPATTAGTLYGTGTACLEVAPGYRVFASDGSTEHGGLPAIDFLFGFSLPNGGATVSLTRGDLVLDAVTYADPASEAVAIQLSSDRLDHVDNDEQAFWCPATTPYGDGLGTPGAANAACPFVVPPGKCAEGLELRDIDEPAPGELVITEIFPDAFGSDTDRQWFEVLVTADVDLNGLQLGSAHPTVRQTIVSDACLPVTAGTYLVFGDPGVPEADHVIGWNLDLPGGATTPGVFVAAGGQLVDAVTYTTAGEGVSRSLSDSATDATANDDEDRWCDAAALLEGGDRGTPGEANPECPGEGECLDGDTARAIVSPSAGDLVISEIMADPTKVGDTAGEYVEVWARSAVDLTGLELELNPDGASPVLHVYRTSACVPVAADSYHVFAHVTDDTANGGLGGVDFRFGFALANGGGVLEVRAGDALDAVGFPASSAGVARSLSDRRLDAAQNDGATSWCPAVTPYGLGDLGTPGAANPNCPLEPGLCVEDGVEREQVVPGEGDLVISEIMATPVAPQTLREWVEVTVLADVDLRGLELGTTGDPNDTLVLDDDDCRARTAGTRLVFARSELPGENGGLPAAAIEAVHAFSLDPTSSVFLAHGDVTLDSVDYTATAGRSFSLDPDLHTPAGNDEASSWCLGTGSYGDGGQGTPGLANPECLQAGECIDPDDGDARALNPPEPGDLVITEFLANPDGDDGGKEWFEVYAVNAFDANGLVARKSSTQATAAFVSATGLCLEADAGSYVVFSDGVTVPNLFYTWSPASFGLNNTNSSLTLELPGTPEATVLDTVAYTGSIANGASRTLKQSLREDPAANDNASGADWCNGITLYDGANRGSPGLPNEPMVCE